jgi:hypothetical protein
MDESLLSLFWGACGAPGPLRLQVDGEGEGTGQWSLPQPFAVVGRDVRADVTLVHNHVSKRHAYVQVIAGRVFCADLASRMGIRWEGANRPSGWMEGTRSLGIGPYEIRLAGDDLVCSGCEAAPADLDLPDPLDRSVPDQDDLPLFSLEDLSLTSRPSWRIDHTVTLIGRSPKCQIFSEQGMSRFHCSLLRTPLGVWAVDLLGQEGIAVNGRSVRCAHLNDGDDLRVGRVLYRIRYGSTGAPGNALGVRPRIGALARLSPKPSSLAQVQPSAVSGELTSPSWPAPVHALSRILVERTADPLLELMVEQFDRMHEQMCSMQQQTSEQFHQTMMAMVQMFGVMHRDQMDLVREELAQIRRLSDELKALQDGTAQGSSQRLSSATVAPLNQEPSRNERIKPDRGLRRGSNAPPGRVSTDSDRTREDPGAVKASSAPDQSLPKNAQRSPLRPAVEPSSDRATGITDVRIHEMLSQRIAELQRERQTRWQRLVGMVGGKC